MGGFRISVSIPPRPLNKPLAKVEATMKIYIDKSQARIFSKALVGIRKNIGSSSLASISNEKQYGVAGNTFRAFRGYNLAPSVVFRNWAKERTEKIINHDSKTKLNQKSFITWHNDLVNSLGSYWLESQGDALSFSHNRKLIDLYVKWLSQFQFQHYTFHLDLNRFSYCALDSQTLSKINKCYSECLPINKASMGDIYNKNTYDFMQKIVHDFCLSCSATPLEFDYWAWKKGG